MMEDAKREMQKLNDWFAAGMLVSIVIVLASG